MSGADFCAWCAGPLPVGASVRRRYCSPTCCHRAERARAKASLPATRSIRCVVCGRLISQPRVGRPRRYCGKACTNRGRRVGVRRAA